MNVDGKMTGILWFCVLVGAANAWLEDDNLLAGVAKGAWISSGINFDDRDEMHVCQLKRYNMIGCYCELGSKDQEANRWCDGNWMTWNDDTDELECHSYTNAHSEGHIRAVAVCQQTLVYPIEPEPVGENRYGENPSVSCPDNYKMLFCWMHSDRMERHHWQITHAELVKDYANNVCSVQGCSECRVQAACARTADVGMAPTLDVFPYPPLNPDEPV